MSLATATEYALMLAADPQPPAEEVRAGPGPVPAGAVRHGLTANEATAGLARLSPRERELVTLIRRVALTRRSRPSCISPCARSARTWTESGTRPAAAAPTSPGQPSGPAWSSSPMRVVPLLL